MAGDAYDVETVMKFNVARAVDDRNDTVETSECRTGYKVWMNEDINRFCAMPDETAMICKHNALCMIGWLVRLDGFEFNVDACVILRVFWRGITPF